MPRKILLIVPLLLTCYLGSTRASCRTPPIESQVDARAKTEIVKKHNDLRIDIANARIRGQPRGVNLKRMSWDDALAREAQKIANTCVFRQSQVTDGRWKWVGQNLFKSMSNVNKKGSNFTQAIMGWFNDHKDYKYNDNKFNQYTQVVWAETDKIGCGFAYYRGDDKKYPYQKLYICNYGPGGNTIGQFPYRKGMSGCENLCSPISTVHPKVKG